MTTLFKRRMRPILDSLPGAPEGAGVENTSTDGDSVTVCRPRLRGYRLDRYPAFTENLIMGLSRGRRRQMELGKPLSRRRPTPPSGQMVSRAWVTTSCSSGVRLSNTWAALGESWGRREA